MATPVRMPRQGNTVESCLIVAWKKRRGEKVEAGEPLLEVETDKALVELESPASGVLLETFFEVGDDVPVTTTIAVIGREGESVAPFAPGAREEPEGTGDADGSSAAAHERSGQPTAPAAAAAASATATGRLRISPRARRLAAAQGFEPRGLAGSGPGGRILERDVARALEAATAQDRPPPAAAPPPEALPGEDALAPLPPETTATALPLTGVRKRIAARMLASLRDTAQLSLGRHADARALLAFRQALKRSRRPEVAAITLNDIVLFAVARSLPEHPELNALFADDTIYQLREVHLGIAVDTPRGLLVPVLHHAQRLGLGELSRCAKDLIDRSRAGRIAPEALQGGSFTVTNLGPLGIEHFTPVLNPPQVGILGVCAITLRPVEEAGEIVHRPHLGLSLTINHQVVDGAPAARFLQTLAERLADPEGLLVA